MANQCLAVAAPCSCWPGQLHNRRAAAHLSVLTSLTEAYLNAAGLKLFEGAAELAAASD